MPSIPTAPISKAVETFGKGWKRRTALSALLGMGVGHVENKTLLSDYDDNIHHINTTLGGVTGGVMGALAKNNPQAALLAGAVPWVGKQLGLLGIGTGKKFVDLQIPVAEKNLESAKLNQITAEIQARKAQRMSAGDMAQIGMAGAGLGAAGGLGYYLYKTIGPGKKKPKPRITIDMPDVKKLYGADIQIEGDEETLNLSKNLYDKLRRDRRQVLLTSTREETKRRRNDRQDKVASHGVLIYGEPTHAERLSNIASLLHG